MAAWWRLGSGKVNTLVNANFNGIPAEASVFLEHGILGLQKTVVRSVLAAWLGRTITKEIECALAIDFSFQIMGNRQEELAD